jgi:hypothetical protein
MSLGLAAPVVIRVGGAVGEHPGLAGARAREQQQWTRAVRERGGLLGSQPLEQPVGDGRWRGDAREVLRQAHHLLWSDVDE